MSKQYTNKKRSALEMINIFDLRFDIKFCLYLALIIVFLFILVFANYYFKVRNINIEILDNQKKINNQDSDIENLNIQKYLNQEIKKEGNSFLNFIFLDKNFITKLVRDEYEIVDTVQFAKKINLNLDVKVSKNDEYFYACADENSEFLLRCMLGNSSGAFFKEVNEYYSNPKVLKFQINTKVLYDKSTGEKSQGLDSLSGTRIYNEKDFLILKEILKWLEKNGFAIKQVFVNELKIVEIKTDFYILKISLDKGYVDTVKDFETISKTGKLQKTINEEKENLEYIDLSFKDKVFFKLKNDIISTATTSNK